ncbi:MAG: MBL fold metallo-hydrolase [Candidatus Thermoplasmatota archaeon]|nr:MBL fold metallo-hydrolase [Candidatus Thermoplasmatota archaeon]
MVSITVYGGVDEIGGNKILLDDCGTKIFLDFGLGFSRRGMYFEEFLNPRTANGIGDFLAMGLLPDIHGVYRSDLLKHLGRKPEEPEIQGVVLSHAHADHANYISFLHEKIPVICGETCKYLLDAVDEQTQRSIENEVLNFKRRPLFRSDYRSPPIKRQFKTFRTGDRINIDNFEIEPVHVDHSVPGAYGFVIHTSAGAIVYTGDLRMHGLHADMTHDFIVQAQKEKPIAMITEGTRINIGKTNESEEQVYQKALPYLNESHDVGIVDFNFKDVDRFSTFFHIAQTLDKTLVISCKHACYLERYHHDAKLKVPNSTDQGIAVIKPKVKTGTYCSEDYTERYMQKRVGYPNIITAEEIAKKPEKYIMILNFWYLPTLIDLQPKKGIYIHSLSEPFNEEMEVSYDRMMNWIHHFHLHFVQAHCSGHINGVDLKELITTIKPETLYPIHTEHPALFQGFAPKVIEVEEGKKYKV